MKILNAQKVLAAIEAGHEQLRWARTARANHVDAYTGRWYGDQANPKKLRPRVMNLMAQAVQSWLPSLAMNNPRFTCKGRLPGLDMQAKLLSSLVNRIHAETYTARTVYRAMIVEALFSPWAPSYTGLRTSNNLANVNGSFYDPGEPFTLAIDFDDWCMDPFAKHLEARRWEAHRFRMSKAEMLENPVFARNADLIASLHSIERGASDSHRDGGGDDPTGVSHGSSDAISDTIECWNIIFYDGNRMVEGTLPTSPAGTAHWLRLAEYHGPDNGPYDHLSFYPVPGKVSPLPPMASSRDSADYADEIASKIARGALKSKRGVAYSPAGKSTAEKINDADDFFTLKTANPKDVQVLDINMVQADMLPLIGWLTNAWNSSAQNPTLMGGNGKISGTATEADILNQRSSIKIGDMQQQVHDLAASHARKMAWFFQTDPLSEYQVPIDSGVRTPGGDRETIVVPYTPMDRTGKPQDFLFETDVVSMVGLDPNIRTARLLQAIQSLISFIPLAQMGIGNLSGFIKILERNLMVENLADILNDPMIVQQALMTAQAETMLQTQQDAAGQQGGAQAPEGSEAGDAGAAMDQESPQAMRQSVRQDANGPQNG